MTERAEGDQERVVLPRAEWKAFADDVRRLIQADEELMNAYNRLLNAYDQLSDERSQSDEKDAQKKRAPGVRGLFGRRQGLTSDRTCQNCGSSLDPKDKNCPGCGRAIDPGAEQQTKSPTG
jgi:hypothetical protein